MLDKNVLTIGIICLLLVVSFSDIVSSQNTSSIITGPSGEEIDGDPDRALITGGVYNEENQTTGTEIEDIGIIAQEVEPTGIEDDEFGIADPDDDDEAMKESGEKGGTEDINIGVGEMQESGKNDTRGIEHEDIGGAATSTDDGAHKGKLEIEVELEKGMIPEIDDEVIVGFESGDTAAFKVEVRGWDPKDKEAAKVQYSESDLNFILGRAARNEEELNEYTRALTQSDPNIENIVITEKMVALDYRFPAKLFGFINIDYTYHAEVDEFGRIKVKLPWYLFLTQNNAGDVTSDLEERLSSVGDDAQLANIDLQNSLQKQQQTFQTISNVMKARHDIAMAAIRNIRT
jgi:hypothetical protein